MKLFYYDLETTGTRFWKNGIHQISGMIEIDGEIKEQFNFKVRPYKDALIEDEALKVGNVTRDQIMAYKSMEETYQELVAMLAKYADKYNKKDKFFLVGYNNAGFDDQFFRAWFTQNRDNYFGSWFVYPGLDVAILAGQFLKTKRFSMVDFKLKTVAKELGFEIDETRLHDASYDIAITKAIYKLITENA